MPRVSVCIPNRNYGRFLGDAIQSALDQTERDIEILIIDDESTDDSVEVAKSFTDARVRVIALDKNIGLIANYNRCVSEARAPYVKLLCSDDLLHPTCVGDLADALDRFPSAAIAFSDREMLFNDGRTEPLISLLPSACEVGPATVIKESMLGINVIGEPTTVMLRKELLKDVKFDRRFVQAPDWQYFLQALKSATVVRVPKILSVFRWHEGNASWWLKRNGTSVHDFLLLAQELDSSAHANYPIVSQWHVRRLRLFCIARGVEMTARNMFAQEWSAARRCWQLTGFSIRDLVRPWNQSRSAPGDF